MKVDVLLGLQWGDEGKGKIVDVLTPNYDIVARFQGGPNAGHTIEFEGNKFILHTIPSGVFDEKIVNIIGNGVIIDPFILKKEIDSLKAKNIDAKKNLLVSKKAHLILPTHRLLDIAYEEIKGKEKIGSTLKGIAPTYTDKIARKGLRVGDLLSNKFMELYYNLRKNHIEILNSLKFDNKNHKLDGFSFEDYEKEWLFAIEILRNLKHIDSEYYINQKLVDGKNILAEGAQGSLLDIDFGSYPYVTSSNTIIAGVCSGLGVSPKKIGKVYGIFKAYCTRVGSGPFPTELKNEDGDKLRKIGNEFGSTTGRPRRCGWLDLPALKYAIMINGVDELLMMKADVLSSFETIKICKAYKWDNVINDIIPYNGLEEKIIPQFETLKGWNRPVEKLNHIHSVPNELMNYIKYIEKETKIPISVLSIGPDRKQTIFMRK